MDRDEIERDKFLRFASLLDECFPATHEHEKPGGENIRALLADRDHLASELQATRAELERVRRSQIRRLDRLANQRCDELLDMDAEDNQGDGFYWRWFGRMIAFRDACRSALASMETGR